MPNVRPFFVNPYMMPGGRDIGPPPVYPNMHKLGQMPNYLYKNKEKSEKNGESEKSKEERSEKKR